MALIQDKFYFEGFLKLASRLLCRLTALMVLDFVYFKRLPSLNGSSFVIIWETEAMKWTLFAK